MVLILSFLVPASDVEFRSPPFNIEDIGFVHLRLKAPGDNPDQIRLIRVDVKIDGSTIFVHFSSAAGWPFIIENGSDYTFSLSQKVRLMINMTAPY